MLDDPELNDRELLLERTVVMNKQTLSYDEETRGKTVINHMGGVFLYNRPEQILEQYELEVKSISRGRTAISVIQSRDRKFCGNTEDQRSGPGF